MVIDSAFYASILLLFAVYILVLLTVYFKELKRYFIHPYTERYETENALKRYRQAEHLLALNAVLLILIIVQCILFLIGAMTYQVYHWGWKFIVFLQLVNNLACVYFVVDYRRGDKKFVDSLIDKINESSDEQ